MIDRKSLVAALDPAVRDYGWLKVLEEAARERLAQLPPYSPELVGRVVRIIEPDWNQASLAKVDWRQVAVAVLDALNGGTE